MGVSSEPIFLYSCKGRMLPGFIKNEGGHLMKQDGTDSERGYRGYFSVFCVSVSLFLCGVKVNSISQKRA